MGDTIARVSEVSKLAALGVACRIYQIFAGGNEPILEYSEVLRVKRPYATPVGYVSMWPFLHQCLASLDDDQHHDTKIRLAP